MQIIEKLIVQLNKLPGIGRKTATRLAFHLINQPKENLQKLADAIISVPQDIDYCKNCFNITSKLENPCSICSNPKRNTDKILVITSIQDLLAVEETQNYKGVYHVLHGVVSPLSGISPKDIKLFELVERVKNMTSNVEIILGITPNVDGETTSMYIKKLLENYSHVKVTQIALGVPIGSEIEYVDKLTLSKAIENRL